MANKLDFTRLPDKVEMEKKGLDFTRLPDTVESPQIEALPENNQAIADAHVNFFSFGMEPGDAEANVEQINGRLSSDKNAQSLKGAIQARMIDVQRRRQPELRQAPERTLWEEVDGYFRQLFGTREAGIAEANIALEARERGISVEEFKRQLVPEGEGLRRIERFGKGIGAGALGSIEGLAGGVQWITDSEMGADLANQASVWRSELAPSAEERDFSDDVAGGFGSMAVFFIPGFGVAQGTQLLFGASTRFAAWAGTGVMTSLEASTEAGLVYRDVLRETGSKSRAEDAATTTFWLNVPLLVVTNKLGIFAEGGSVINRAIRGAVLEGTQEAGQEVISGVATGDTPAVGDLVRAFGVGAIVGGGVSIITAAAQDKAESDLTPQDTDLIEGFQQRIQGIAEEAEAVQVAEGEEITTEAFEQLIASEATEEEIVGQITPTEEEIPDTLEGIPEETEILSNLGQVEDEAALPDLENLGRRVIAEGVTDEQTFTERMKTKLGDLWERFKGFMTRVFNKLKEERGSIEFGPEEARPLFPDLKLDESLKPILDISQRMVNLRALVEAGGRQIESIEELRGVDKAVILNVIDKVQSGEALTNTREKEVVTAIAESIGGAFFAQVQATKGDFLDATENLAEGELNQIINQGISDFIDTVQFQEIAKPTRAELLKGEIKEQGETIQALTKEAERLKTVAQERSQQVFRQEEVTEQERERVDLLVSEIGEQVKLARIARREGRQEAVEQARTKINALRRQQAQARTVTRIERATRRTLTELASETLPVALRGKFLKAIANSTTATQFGNVAERIQDAANAFEEAKRLKKNLGSKRSKIAFIRKINEINQTVINDIKSELDIKKPLSQMNDKELDAITEKLKARVRFKRSRGFRPAIEKRGSKRTDIPETVYEINRNIQPSRKSAFVKKAKEVGENAVKTVDKLLGPISTRLANISPTLRQALRRFEFAVLTQTQKDNRAVLPYLEKVGKLSKDNYADLDMALKNGDTTKIQELTEEHGFTDEYEAVKEVLDNIYARANEVGFDIGYLENYFPRIIKDSAGFLEFMSDREDWSILDEAIKRKEFALGRALVEQEKVNLINNMIRGYSGGNITLSATGNMKDRIIDFVTPEMNVFYSDSNSALINYLESVNEAIEARKLFGKSRPTDSKVDEFNNLEDSLGFYILDLINEGTLKPSQEKEVRTILTARFEQKGTRGLVGIYKNLSYLTVMGSVFNAITQIGDLSFAIYAGGLRDSLPAAVKSIIGKSVIKKEDIGIERIATEVQEKSKMAAMVDTVFRLVGLTQMDRVGKEALINSVVSKYQRLARQDDAGLTRDLKEIFGNETEDVLQDLRDGIISENVKYLSFNELLNFQPVALSEVPEQYLKAGNGRIFYMLKTWSIKMLDVYRNEVYNQMSDNPTQAIRNFIRLSALLMAMNATADILKDLLLGREIDFNDLAVDNVAKLIGFSRYTVFQVRREGLGSAIGQMILPPTKLVDDITKDVIKLYDDFEENFAVDKLKTIESIPVIGKLYYWWFGRGSEIKERRRR